MYIGYENFGPCTSRNLGMMTSWTIYVLLVLCEKNPPPKIMRNFDDFLAISLNKLLNELSRCLRSEAPWRLCNGIIWANDRESYACNVFSHWLRPCQKCCIVALDLAPSNGGYFKHIILVRNKNHLPLLWYEDVVVILIQKAPPSEILICKKPLG